MKFIQQFELRKGDSVLMTWLEAGKVRQGNLVRLKGIEGWWKVYAVYSGIYQESTGLKRDWKVGGLK